MTARMKRSIVDTESMRKHVQTKHIESGENIDIKLMTLIPVKIGTRTQIPVDIKVVHVNIQMRMMIDNRPIVVHVHRKENTILGES